MKILKRLIKHKQISKCPFNQNIKCVSGLLCDGCSHEFDNLKGGN